MCPKCGGTIGPVSDLCLKCGYDEYAIPDWWWRMLFWCAAIMFGIIVAAELTK